MAVSKATIKKSSTNDFSIQRLFRQATVLVQKSYKLDRLTLESLIKKFLIRNQYY